jgi:predicted RNA-binding protein with PUA-like domain
MDKMPQPVNFDRMSGDYKEYFDNKAAVDDNEWSSQGVAFNDSVRNITGMSKQLKDLKEALKKQYPREWKKKYLDIPEKPTKEKERKESGSVFDLLEKKMKESKK